MSNPIKAILADKAKLREVTQAAFNGVDTDKSGTLDLTELRQVMEKVAVDSGAEPPFEDQVKEVMIALDKNGDGVLTVEEFERLIVDVLTAMVDE